MKFFIVKEARSSFKVKHAQVLWLLTQIKKQWDHLKGQTAASATTGVSGGASGATTMVLTKEDLEKYYLAVHHILNHHDLFITFGT